MPLPENDEHICMMEENGKAVFATPEDHIKFLKLVGETIFDNLDSEKNDDESCPDCGFITCVCDDENDDLDEI